MPDNATGAVLVIGDLPAGCMSLAAGQTLTGTGTWSGKTNQIAVRVASNWEYTLPKVGWLCFVEDEAVLSAYKTTGWSAGIPI